MIPPTMLPNLERFYTALEAQASRNKDGSKVYEGHPTRLVQELGWPVQYYSKLRRYLLAMGCIQVIKRGAHHANTQWELVMPPTTELLAAADPDTLVPSRDTSEMARITNRRIKDIVDMLGGHEDRLNNIENKLTVLLAQLKPTDLQGDRNAEDG